MPTLLWPTITGARSAVSTRNTFFFNVTGALAMLVGRFWILLPTLALAGSLARKNTLHISEGTLPTHTPLFALWLILVYLRVGAMSFLPALALGPIVEHLFYEGLRPRFHREHI